MRIIAGKYKGRRLARPEGPVRPTTDRLRESLFNVVGPSVVDSVWLDAFAGTGAVGLEALSRGASLVIFNDQDRNALRTLRKNVQLCGADDRSEVLEKNVFTLLDSLTGRPIDFVFLDPPYDFSRYRKLFEKLQRTLARQDLVVFLEIFKKTVPDIDPQSWKEMRRIKAGDSLLLLLRPI